MTKKQVRDSSYYEERLKREHPSVYGELKAGKYRTVIDAAVAVGLRKPRTRFQELKNAWQKSNRSEQHEFLKWIRAGAVIPAIPSTIAIDGRLVPAVSHRIEEIMSKRRLKPGDVMDELGRLSCLSTLHIHEPALQLPSEMTGFGLQER